MKKIVALRTVMWFMTLIFLFSSVNVRADLIVCNESDDELSIAMIYEHLWRFGEPPTWPARGWFHVGSGKCKTLYIGAVGGFLSIYKKNAAGDTSLAKFKERPIDSLRGTGAIGFNQEVCLPNESFEGRYRDKLKEYKVCRDDEEKQKINVAFQVLTRTNFTLTVN